ncbi:MAG: hypothetical protein CSB44_03690 [Gammaproteobacteria bacterium]|nr:MAG: hypothetical protein CSB44_03690 [Gammaproteobacteria bacterium]
MAVTIYQPSSSNLEGDSATFAWTDSDGCTYAQLVVYDTAHDEIYNSGLLSEPMAEVTGLPTDGQKLDVLAGCWVRGEWSTTEQAFNAFDPSAGGSDEETGDSTVTGVVTLAEGSEVILSSGMTQEQFDSMATSIVLMLAIAMGVRQILKVLT